MLSVVKLELIPGCSQLFPSNILIWFWFNFFNGFSGVYVIVLWFLLFYFLFCRLNLEEELDHMKVHQSVGKFTIQEFNYVYNKKGKL